MPEETNLDHPSRVLRPALLLAVLGHGLAVGLMVRRDDLLMTYLAAVVPLLAAVLAGPAMHWPREWITRWRLSRPLEGHLPRLYLSRHGTWLRGHGVGLIAMGILALLGAYTEALTLRLLLGAALILIGLVEAGLAHGHTAGELRRALRPWRALRELMDIPDLSRARDTAKIWERLNELPDPSGEAVRHGQIWLEQMRHRSVKQVQGLAKIGRGKEAALEIDRWPSVRDDVTALMLFLQLGPEPLTTLRDEVLRTSDLLWVHECSEAESLIEEATVLEDKAEGSASLEKLDEALGHLPEIPGAPVQDLRDRIFAMQRLINERLIETHRAAEAAADAVKEPVEHPYTDTPQPHPSAGQRAGQRVDHEAKTEEALSHTRQFLAMHDHQSAHGWLLHAEHHAAQVVSVQGVALREQVEEVREKCEVKPPSEEEGKTDTVDIDPEKVLEEYLAKHGPPKTEEESVPTRTWQNAMVLMGSAFFFLGFFFLDWQQYPKLGGLNSGVGIFDLPGLISEEMGRGLISHGMLAYLELIAAALLCFGVLLVTVVAVVRINGEVPKALGRNAIISLLIGLFALCGIWMLALSNQSALVWNIIKGHVDFKEFGGADLALPPQGSQVQMISLLVKSAGLGLWTCFVSLMIVCVGVFSGLKSK